MSPSRGGALAGAFAPLDFTGAGPCTVDASAPRVPIALPAETGCGRDCHIELQLTAPAQTPPAQGSPGADDTGACSGPRPVLFFYSGFQLRASFYEGYAERLASWGHVVVRYDLELLDLVPSGVQVAYVPHILQRLAQLTSDLSSVWHQRLDLSRLAAAGHSRGGKLAALHLAAPGPPVFSAAYLLDPVDSDGGEQDPSAVEALRGLGKSLGITAAGVIGSCNPEDRTQGFWEVAGPGSWRETVVHGGHVQFCNITSSLVERALDALCGKGGDSHEAVVELTLPPLVAWLESTFSREGKPVRHDTAGRPQMLPAQQPWWGGLWPSRVRQQRKPLHGHGTLGRGVKPQGSSGRSLLLSAAAPEGVIDDGAGGAWGSFAPNNPFWDWVQRQEQVGEIKFELK